MTRIDNARVIRSPRGTELTAKSWLTEAPLRKALVMLAVPMIMEMLMESIFAVVDVFWVAHLGASAVATVGLTESMMMIIYSLAMGVSIGAMALVARSAIASSNPTERRPWAITSRSPLPSP